MNIVDEAGLYLLDGLEIPSPHVARWGRSWYGNQLTCFTVLPSGTRFALSLVFPVFLVYKDVFWAVYSSTPVLFLGSLVSILVKKTEAPGSSFNAVP